MFRACAEITDLDPADHDQAALAATAPALFVRDGERFVPTVLCQGPWAKDLQFGGSPAALLATVVDDLPSLVPMRIARLTVDLLRPVPMAPMTLETAVRREGKKIQVVDASVVVGGVEVVRATAVRLRRTDPAEFAGESLPRGEPRPEALVPADRGRLAREFDRARVGYVPGIRFGSDIALDPEHGWASPYVFWRLRAPVIAGEPAKPVARLCFVADGSSGVGHSRAPNISGINADISIHVVREPVSEWLCVEGTGWIGDDGIAHSNATISDEIGVSAAILLTRLVERVR